MRHGGQAAPAGDGEGPLPGGRLPGALIVGQAEADHLARLVSGVAHRQARKRAGVQRVTHPGGRHDDRHLHPAQGRGLLGGIEDDLQGGGDPADEGGVAGWVDLDLQAARALGGIIQGGLQDDAAHDLLGAHQGPGRVIGALEAEPAAPVSGHAQGVAVQEVRGQARARAGGQLNEGLQAHRPREVQVQVRLGKSGEVSHGWILPRVRTPPAALPREAGGTEVSRLATFPGATDSLRGERRGWTSADRGEVPGHPASTRPKSRQE